ncbi:hypothetical protein [Chelativorans sp. Marseille-P2723]|uniref:hypothetical protein n=1 Tax=Chelativorans sp. Marseille-P2723 TaxID=2709133 RepID=UPI00156D8B24|nr:hypothetical protein [Chelativorans sp. Marseille-P2723]
MREQPEITLAEALAIRERYGRVGYPSRALKHILYLANQEVEKQASIAVARLTDGLCVECWGDGFRRISSSMLGGPCEKCGGTGRTALNKEGQSDE